jgi:DNA-binding SARP family transcriptional activator/Flp pilus assembly protein TadD
LGSRQPRLFHPVFVMFRVRLFGGATIEGANGVLSGPAVQRMRLALLALLATTPAGGLSRDKAASYLWPEADAATARRHLKDAVYGLRSVLGKAAILAAGDELRLNPALVETDVSAFRDGLERGAAEAAADLYRGPFLDGFFVAKAPEFERWLDAEREHWSRQFGKALESVAAARAASADHTGAAEVWRRRAAHEPFSSRVALQLMHALAAAGDRPAAVRHARLHQALCQSELGVPSDAEVAALAEQLAAGREPAPSGTIAAREAAARPPLAAGPAIEPAPAVGSSAGDGGAAARFGTLRRAATISGLAVVALAAGMYAEGRGGSTAPPTPDPAGADAIAAADIPTEAADLYLRGRFTRRQVRADDALAAVELLEQAVALAPQFAAAHGQLALAYSYLYSIFEGSSPDLLQKGFLAADRALALDPGQANAHVARGRLLWTPGSGFAHQAAVAEYLRAIERDPASVEARVALGLTYIHMGLLDEAIEEFATAMSLDPADPRPRLGKGQALLYQMKPHEALHLLREAPPDMNPQHNHPHLAWALLLLGRLDEAERVLDEASRHAPEDRSGTIAGKRAVLAAARGDGDAARAAIRAAAPKPRRTVHGHHVAYDIGSAYALLGVPDSASLWLRAAAEEGFPSYPLYRADPALASLHSDPGFAALLAELRLEWLRFRRDPSGVRPAGGT